MNRFYPFFIFSLTLLFCDRAWTQNDPFIWTSDCADRTVCLNQNNCSVGNALIWQEAWSSCGGAASINYSYRIDYNIDGSMDVISAADTLTGPVPKGTHRVFWRAADQCGRVITCSHQIVVEDCQAPSIICSSGFTIGLNEPDCVDKFSVKRFIISYSDNCTPTDKIKLGIRKLGTGTGFPTTDSVAFERCDVGVNLLEIWARDERGRANQCNTFVLLQLNTGVCPCITDGDIGLKGCARVANNTKLNNYQIAGSIVTAPNGQPALNKTFNTTVTSDSCYSVVVPKVPLGGPYLATVRATKQSQPLEGVTTLDLALMSKHILGLDTFKNIYQVLAADVNSSKTVTTFDVVEARKVILGIYDSFPGTPSWLMMRPVANPAATRNFNVVRDTYQIRIPEVVDDVSFSKLDFIGVKVGDVNYTAPAFLKQAIPEARSEMPILVEDRLLKPGTTVQLPLRWGEAANLNAWQLALVLDPTLVQITGVEGLAAENYALRENGELRALWFSEQDFPVAPQMPVLNLTLRVLQESLLSQALRLAPEQMVPEAYSLSAGSRPESHNLNLHFTQPTADNQVWMAAPQPNPFSTQTTFRFHLAQAETVHLNLVDAAGRTLYAGARNFSAGAQEWLVDDAALSGAGVLLYRMLLGKVVFGGKLVRE